MASIKENLARFGMISKGVVYSLIGILTALAAFGYGGKKAGSKGSLEYLASQSFGTVLLVVLGLGLCTYVVWRLYQAFGKHDKFDDDAMGYAKRFAYFLSALVYGTLSYYAFQLVGGDGTNGRSMSVSNDSNFAGILTIGIGIGLAIKAVYDFYRAYSKKFREDIDELEMGRDEKKMLLNTGRLGHTARGVVLGFMAYLTFSSYDKISRQTEAFKYIEQNFGSIALGAIAVGLVCYGVYMFMKAKYPDTVLSSSR